MPHMTSATLQAAETGSPATLCAALAGTHRAPGTVRPGSICAMRLVREFRAACINQRHVTPARAAHVPLCIGRRDAAAGGPSAARGRSLPCGRRLADRGRQARHSARTGTAAARTGPAEMSDAG